MFFSVVLEGETIGIDIGTLEQVSEIPYIIEIHSPYRGCIFFVPSPLFLPKGRNIIQWSWISFYIGAFLTGWRTTFRGGGLPCLSSSSHFSPFYILDVCYNGGVLITPSIHTSCVFHISFWGRVFPLRFSLFLHFMRDCIFIMYMGT